MKIPENYRKPAIFVVILHVILLCVLIFSFADSLFRMPPSSSPAKTLHAVAVTESSVQAEVHQTQQQQKLAIAEQEKQEKIEKQQKIEKQEEIEKQQQIAKQKIVEKQHQLALIKTEQLEKIQAEIKAKKLKALKRKEAIAQIKAQKLKVLAKAKKQAEMQKLKAKTNALAAEQKKLQQQLMQQQMNSEQKNISAAVTQAQQGAIDKYKAEILAAIQSNWRIDQINSQLKCVYSVDVAPDGSVLSLKLMQSSGDTALDQSAQQAITLASPLPVPHNPALFNHFRQLVLTLSPQGILQSVGST